MTRYDCETVFETWAKRQGVAVDVVEWRARMVLVTVTRGGAAAGARVVTYVLDLDAAEKFTPAQWGEVLGELARRAGLNSVDATGHVAATLDRKSSAGWMAGRELRVVRHGEDNDDAG